MLTTIYLCIHYIYIYICFNIRIILLTDEPPCRTGLLVVTGLLLLVMLYFLDEQEEEDTKYNNCDTDVSYIDVESMDHFPITHDQVVIDVDNITPLFPHHRNYDRYVDRYM